jgi:protoporphyrinogen oxidase
MSFTQYLREAETVKSVVKPHEEWLIELGKASETFVKELEKKLKGKEVEFKTRDKNLVKRLKVKGITFASNAKNIESDGTGLAIVGDDNKNYEYNPDDGIKIL